MESEAAHQRPERATESPPSRAWIGWTIQILCLVYAAFVIVQNVGDVLWYAPTELTSRTGTLDAKFSRRFPGGGFLIVTSVAPGGAMAAAGVAAGDRVRFDRTYDYYRRKPAGERVGFTLVHARRAVHHQVATTPRKAQPMTSHDWLGATYQLSTTLAALFGAFIVWRSRRNPTTILLGMGLLTYGLITPVPQLWLSAPPIFPLVNAIGQANLMVISILFYAFAMRFYGDYVGPVKPFERVAFWAYAVVMILAGVLGSISEFDAVAFPVIGNGETFSTVAVYVGFAICLGYLIVGWRRSAASVQQRYALMLIATSAIIVAQALDIILSVDPSGPVEIFHFIANSVLTGIIASGLFAYSILRHKVFDLGFAVNRTLVYGVVSAILLAAFGLIEWAVDHFVPIHSREKNALVDAVIAVGVFLTFHRVRDFVEHGIEGLFFRRWQKAETRLRRFVREAAFITDSQALTQAFARALSDFAEGAQAAIYLEDGRGYARAGGAVAGMASLLDANLPAIVALRADLKPAEVHDDAPGAALLAPMVNRNEVIGLAALGPKASGLAFRPDEIELVGWATQQVGLDLHALQVERFAALADELRQENATLRSLIPQRA